MSRDKWIDFFTEARIPLGAAKQYAKAFDDNRISTDMLMDLNKDYLRDMGITILGDIIAILKHSKQVQAQLTTEQDTGKAPSRTVTAAAAAAAPDVNKADKPARKVRIATTTTVPAASGESNPEKTGTKPASKVKQRLGPPNTITFDKPKVPPKVTPKAALPKPLPMPVDVFDRLGPAEEDKPSLTPPNRIVIDHRSPPTEPGRAPPNARLVIDRNSPAASKEGSNKKYVLVSKLKDGRKVQEILKPNDPRIQQLGVTKKLVLPAGALKRSTSSPAMPRKEVARPSPTKRARITGPGDSDSDRDVMREPRSSLASRLGPKVGASHNNDGPVARARVAYPRDTDDKVVKKPRAARITFEGDNTSSAKQRLSTSRLSSGGSMYSSTPPEPVRKRIEWNGEDASGDGKSIQNRLGYHAKSRNSF